MPDRRRPSEKELAKKLNVARSLLVSQQFNFLALGEVIDELHELDLFSQNEIEKALAAILSEVRPIDWAGRRPPEQSYEKSIQGAELFAFAWESSYFGGRIYFKFAVSGRGSEARLIIVSLHLDRPRNSRGTGEKK